MEESEILSYSVLFIGVGLLVFTFFNVFMHATDLIEAFGKAIGPLIEACMYLGIMGWIGSILTIRGIKLLTQLKHKAKA